MNEKTELSDEQIMEIAHRTATRYTHRSDPNESSYGFMRHTMLDFARKVLAASPSSKGTKERSDKEYAIEHAGYMATAARDYLIAVGAEGVARMDDEEEGTEATADKLEQAMAGLVEAGSTLSNRIYEFEKRRDRALASSSIKEDGERAELLKQACDLLDGVSDLALSAEWNEQRKAVLDRFSASSSPPSPLGDTPEQQEQKR